MLIQFRFKNFRSFRDDTVLDFSAASPDPSNNQVIRMGKSEKILPAAAVFGANASGKSNIIKAFSFMTEYVLYSQNYSKMGDERKSKVSQPKLTPFLFTRQPPEDSLFEIHIIENESQATYSYGFTICSQGINEEWLFRKAKTSSDRKCIFYRNNGFIETEGPQELDLSGLNKMDQKLVKAAISSENLALSNGAMLHIKHLETVYDWFRKNEIIDSADPLINFLNSTRIPEGFGSDTKIQEKLIHYLGSFDTSIHQFEVEKIEDEDDSKNDRYLVNSIHHAPDNTAYRLSLSEESAGTLKMFSLYPYLQSVLKSGAVLVIDELNSRLHPLLIRLILQTFVDQELNPNHAQILFTSHDPWIMDIHLLRTDEIWFTEKQSDGNTELYSLADFRIHKEKPFEESETDFARNYLLGKFGGIPELSTLFPVFRGKINE